MTAALATTRTPTLTHRDRILAVERAEKRLSTKRVGKWRGRRSEAIAAGLEAREMIVGDDLATIKVRELVSEIGVPALLLVLVDGCDNASMIGNGDPRLRQAAGALSQAAYLIAAVSR